MSSPAPPEPAAEARRYRVRHITRYRYETGVVLAHHLLHLTPRAIAHQKLASHRIAIDPTPAVTAVHNDLFGNPVTYVAVQEPHRALVITSELAIEVTPPAAIAADATPPWEELRDGIAASADASACTAAIFAYASPRTPIMTAVSDYAAPSFTPGRPIAAAAIDLMARIHQEFVFDPGATTVSTPLDQVLAARRGVCQDLAHLQIACLRARGLAARYVSGYLRTVPPPGQERIEGADASHAWGSVWCGGAVWLDLDPTNGKRVTDEYVTLAWGRDYDDVSPVRGVLFGGGSHSLAVSVDVA